jgi:hypothetical protein
VSISEARDVRVKGTVRESSITVGRLGSVAEAVGRAVRGTLANWSIEVLHAEQVRGDKRVPPGVRQYSRFEELNVPE